MKVVNDAKSVFRLRANRIIVYFFIYSFIGWCIEVTYTSIRDGYFQNRGFLVGPFCCIYGFGALLIIIFLKRFRHNAFLLFASAATLTSILEYFTGYFLEKTFNNKWWDYSDQPLNLAGRICLRNSLFWGIIAVVVVYFIHPFIRFAALEILRYTKPFVANIIVIYFVSDFIVSYAIAANMTSNTSILHEIVQEFKNFLRYMQGVTLRSIESLRNEILTIKA